MNGMGQHASARRSAGARNFAGGVRWRMHSMAVSSLSELNHRKPGDLLERYWANRPMEEMV